jgi:hypothetical protein
MSASRRTSPLETSSIPASIDWNQPRNSSSWRYLPAEHELTDRALLGREEQEALGILAPTERLQHVVDEPLHGEVASALTARGEHRLPPRLDPAEVVGEEERGGGDGVVAVALVSFLHPDPAGLDDVEDARLQFGGGLGERLVDAFGGLDRRLLLRALLALALQLVAQALGAHREQPGDDDARDAQQQRDDRQQRLGPHG